jgi:hypothetical protein
LKGFVYDLTEEHTPDQYIKTTKEIVLFVARTYKSYTSELVQGTQQLELDDIQGPYRAVIAVSTAP